MKILVVEDDIKIAHLLRDGLQKAEFEVDVAASGKTALEIIIQKNTAYDLIILDLMLPEIDGLSLLGTIRASKSTVPVIILSAKHTSDDRITGLRNGADDYLVKPFSFPELLIRIQNLLRRMPKAHDVSTVEFEDLRIDMLKREVYRSSRKIELQAKEFALLVYLTKNSGKILPKSTLLNEIWGYSFDPQTNVVDVLICRLRNKIDKGFEIKLIHTIRGLGYVCRKN